MRFCSYNLVFNKIPNNSDATLVINNVLLAMMCAKIFLMVVTMQNAANLWETKVNNKKEINFLLRNNGGHAPNSLLGSRSIVVVRQ